MKDIFKLLLIVFMTLFETKVFAYDVAVENEDGVTIYYNYISKGLTVTYGNPENGTYKGNVVIPQTVIYDDKTFSVVAIGISAFKGCSELTSITIPNTINYIYSNAFDGCINLASLTIEDGDIELSSIANFKDCPLEYVYMGRNITDKNNKPFRDKTTITELVIGNKVTSIEHYAFYGCTGLTSATIPNSVNEIGVLAFENCSNLNSLIIEKGDSLLSFMFSPEENPKPTFDGCPINSLYLGRNIICLNSYYLSKGTESPFKNNETLTSLTISNNVMKLGGCEFDGCTGLKSLTIEDGDSTISLGEWKSAIKDCPLGRLYTWDVTLPIMLLLLLRKMMEKYMCQVMIHLLGKKLCRR